MDKELEAQRIEAIQDWTVESRSFSIRVQTAHRVGQGDSTLKSSGRSSMEDDREGGSSVRRKSWVRGDGSKRRKQGKREGRCGDLAKQTLATTWPKDQWGV